MKKNYEQVPMIINEAIFKQINKIDLENYDFEDLKTIYDALCVIASCNELFTANVHRYIMCIEEMFGDKLEEFDGATPRTTAEIMKEYGLNEADYH